MGIEVGYGPRSTQVAARLGELKSLDAVQLKALSTVWGQARNSAGEARIFDAAWSSKFNQFTSRALDDLFSAVQGSSLNAAWAAVMAELVAGEVDPDYYASAAAPLVFALDLPPWWSDTGARSLFFELLEAHEPVTDACAAVTALI